ncbi:MAG: hypothetical protein JNK82_29780 [Myxococcaceae bacterium]|nr:hypothetical protein [Myxococcaceae bacterium]
MVPASVTTWVVQVRWGDRRLHAEALDAEGRTSLVLGRGEGADVELGTDATAKLQWTPLGLKVQLSSGFRGQASLKGDSPVALNGLVTRGKAKETAEGLELFLESGDSVVLYAGQLKVEVRPAFLPVRRLPIDVRVLGVLALAIAAVALVIFSVVST